MPSSRPTCLRALLTTRPASRGGSNGSNAALVDGPNGNVVGVFGGLHPEPGLLDLRRVEVVRRSGEKHSPTDEGRDDFFPRLGANQRDPGDVVGVLVQERNSSHAH